MDKTGSFKKAMENAKSVGFKNAMKKMNAVDLNAEFLKRGVNINSGSEK